ncbi:MAG TPA: type IV pilin protein [Thauera sp.]|nr:type IV pilin protein [Thauera sp.]
MNAKHSLGFTLVELMITVAILGILASIAYPGYRDYVIRANRADARAALVENAQFLERNFTVANSYRDTTTPDTDPDNEGGFVSTAGQLPRLRSPATGAARYEITIAFNNGGRGFTLSAAPTGTMAGDPCGTLTLTHTGVRGAAGAVATCWN